MRLNTQKIIGNTNKVSTVAEIKPPIITIANGFEILNQFQLRLLLEANQLLPLGLS